MVSKIKQDLFLDLIVYINSLVEIVLNAFGVVEICRTVYAVFL